MAIQLRKRSTRAFVAGCLVLGLISAAPFAGAGTAAADGHNIVDHDGTWGDPDAAEQRGTSLAPAIHSIDTSANNAPSWPAAPTWPAPPSWGSYPAPASYPAVPSWPGSGWGAADD
jgi:hypothetical protein